VTSMHSLYRKCFLKLKKVNFIPVIQALTARSDSHEVFPLHTKSKRIKHLVFYLEFFSNVYN